MISIYIIEIKINNTLNENELIMTEQYKLWVLTKLDFIFFYDPVGGN